MQKKTKIIIAVSLLVVLFAALALVWHFNNPANDANDFDKQIEVTVTHGDGSTKDFTIQTNEKFLRGALEQEKLVEGTESEYGLFITTVDGETADDANQEWWCINDGEGTMLPTGVDETAINDGDSYELVLTVGW